MPQPEVAGLLERERTTKGERQRKGERENKIKREVGIDIDTACAMNQVYDMLAQDLHAKIFLSDALPSMCMKRKSGSVVKRLEYRGG